jgi:hypothetical protein
VTDELHHDISAWAGDQQGATGANQGFSSAQAVADCESGWEQALSVLGADLAAAGDTLSLNASNYATTEQHIVGRLRPI